MAPSWLPSRCWRQREASQALCAEEVSLGPFALLRALWQPLLPFIVAMAVISCSDLCFERLNSNYISEHHLLSAWYIIANIYSCCFGFYSDVILPWRLSSVSRLLTCLLLLWCISWDMGCRLFWFFWERSARLQHEAPKRWPMIFWAVGNDLNSLLVVPIMCTFALQRKPASQELDDRGTRGGRVDWMALGCMALGLCFTMLDYWIFQVVTDVWWAHVMRLSGCMPLLALTRCSGEAGRTYGVILVFNLFFDWTWATLRLVAGAILSGRDLRLVRALLYQSVFEIISLTLKGCMRGRSVEDVIVLRFILTGFNEYFLTMLLLESDTVNLQFCLILVFKLFQKSVKAHPGFRTLMNGLWAALLQRLGMLKCLKVYMAVLGFQHTELRDKTLLLSHVASLVSCFALASALVTDVLFDAGPFIFDRAGSRWQNRQQVALLLLLLFLGEWSMLWLHAHFSYFSRKLVPGWLREDLVHWEIDLPWWQSFLSRRWLAAVCSFGLCIARSHEQLLTRLNHRSDG
ncbi:unnamed protein product [Effrenium voratum]|uniref:Uncharacterized protein n=1 Tax=Effrenium voratum TaxID=2562239 RepID=A0AA36MQK7_9DINO|nr:unnamed protein product [Effrenium voratum]